MCTCELKIRSNECMLLVRDSLRPVLLLLLQAEGEDESQESRERRKREEGVVKAYCE